MTQERYDVNKNYNCIFIMIPFLNTYICLNPDKNYKNVSSISTITHDFYYLHLSVFYKSDINL